MTFWSALLFTEKLLGKRRWVVVPRGNGLAPKFVIPLLAAGIPTADLLVLSIAGRHELGTICMNEMGMVTFLPRTLPILLISKS